MCILEISLGSILEFDSNFTTSQIGDFGQNYKSLKFYLSFDLLLRSVLQLQVTASAGKMSHNFQNGVRVAVY